MTKVIANLAKLKHRKLYVVYCKALPSGGLRPMRFPGPDCISAGTQCDSDVAVRRLMLDRLKGGSAKIVFTGPRSSPHYAALGTVTPRKAPRSRDLNLFSRVCGHATFSPAAGGGVEKVCGLTGWARGSGAAPCRSGEIAGCERVAQIRDRRRAFIPGSKKRKTHRGVIAAAVGHYSGVAFIVDEDEGIYAVIFFVRENSRVFAPWPARAAGRLFCVPLFVPATAPVSRPTRPP